MYVIRYMLQSILVRDVAMHGLSEELYYCMALLFLVAFSDYQGDKVHYCQLGSKNPRPPQVIHVAIATT